MAGSGNGAIFVDIVADTADVKKNIGDLRDLSSWVFGDIKKYASDAFANIKSGGEKAKSTFSDLMNKGLVPFREYLGGKFLDGIKAVTGGFGEIKDSGAVPLDDYINKTLLPDFENMSSGLISNTDAAENRFKGLLDFINSTFAPDWENMWGGIETVFSGIWNGMELSFKGSANSMIRSLNGLIAGAWRGLSGIVDAVSSMVAGFGDILGFSDWGFKMPSAPHIPMLAAGGIVQAPTLAMVGERGREAVLPLDNNTGWMVNLANTVADAVSANIGQRQARGGNVNLYLDGKRLAEAVIDDFSEVALRKGAELRIMK